MGCADAAYELEPGCGALKKIAGVAKKFWVGNVDDISSVTFGATNGELLTLVLSTGKRLWNYEGKKEKHNGTFPTKEGDNITLFTQTFNAVLYFKTAAERKAVEALAKSEGIFVIIEENDGSVTVWGLSNNTDLGYDNFYLKGAGDGGTGALMNDDNSYKIALSGDVPNIPVIYKPAQTLAANIAELVAMETPA